MTDSTHHLPDEPEFRSRGIIDINPIWIVPLVALLVGIWLAYQTISGQGPEIVIEFKRAEGIEANKTRVRFNDVEVGVVKEVRLSPNMKHVNVTVAMSQGSEPLLTKASRIWVVRPRLSLYEISGLDTLVSGTYIEIDPAPGEPARHFIALDEPPLVRADMPGVSLVLRAPTLGSLAVGSPIYYRDIHAGDVMGYTLASNQQEIIIHTYIHAPYHKLVFSTTRFWKESGVDISLTTEGVQVRSQSLRKLALGGITFNTPEFLDKSQLAQEGQEFTLFDDEKSADEMVYRQHLPFVLYFQGSVRGLQVGAPVEFRGIKVGQVSEIRMEFDRETTTFLIPVLILIEPERINEITGAGKKMPPSNPIELIDTLVKRGLRARLDTGSFLTGQRYVLLDMFPDTPVLRVGKAVAFPELPTVPASFDEITNSISDLMAKLRTLPMEEIGGELKETMRGLNHTVNAPEVKKSMESLGKTLTHLEGIMARVRNRVEPIAANLQNATAAATGAFTTFDQMMNPDAPLNYHLLEVTQELSLTARAIRGLINTLERQPESLLFGKGYKE